MDANTPETYFRQMPVVTRAIVVMTFIATLLSVLGIFNISYLLLDWTLVYKKLHLWRLITDYLFVGGFSFGWLFHMYFFTAYSSRLEKNNAFTSRVARPGDYLYFVFLQMIALDILSLICYYPRGKPVLAPSLSFAIIYYWSKREAFAPVSLWGFSLFGWQLPYSLVVLDLLMGQSIWPDLMGLMTGHLYHFIMDVLPEEKGIRLLGPAPDIFSLLTEKLDFMSNYSRRPPTTTTNANNNNARNTHENNSRLSSLFGSFRNNSTQRNLFSGRGYRISDTTQSTSTGH